MKKATETILAILVISIVFCGAYFALKKVKESILLSCVYSVGDVLVEYSNITTFAKDDADWYVLTDGEADSFLSKHKVGDCQCFGSKPQDISYKKYQIAVRRSGESSFHVKVWSKGFDNISGTDDDLVF
jgi:hypothetical protein